MASANCASSSVGSEAGSTRSGWAGCSEHVSGVKPVEKTFHGDDIETVVVVLARSRVHPDHPRDLYARETGQVAHRAPPFSLPTRGQLDFHAHDTWRSVGLTFSRLDDEIHLRARRGTVVGDRPVLARRRVVDPQLVEDEGFQCDGELQFISTSSA